MLGSGGSNDLLVERDDRCIRLSCGSEAIGVWKADRVLTSESCCVDSDLFVRSMDRHSERSDRLARPEQQLRVAGRGNQHLRQINGADQPDRRLLLPACEESPCPRMVYVGPVECADQDVSVENQAQG